MILKTYSEYFTNPLYLESGRILEPYTIVYETYGELNQERDNAIIIAHALSGSHHAAGFYEGDSKPGWWNSLIGDGKAIDTKKYFVICTNVIGSCFGSTGPISENYPSMQRYRFKFPVVTIKDMVKAQKILFNKIGIDRARAIIGGSMGGMQVLRFAIDYPTFADMYIPMACSSATSPKVIASLKIMMDAIKNDERFENGNYDPLEFKEVGCAGLAVGRMVGFLDYLSFESMNRKFSRNYVETDGYYELFGRFEVERYLEYNSSNFSKSFDPLSYLYIIKAISLFDLSYGHENLGSVLKSLKRPMHLISFSGDNMFLPKEMRAIKECAHSIGLDELVSYHEVDSDYGHDAFLVEVDKFEEYLSDILKG